jgi:hypothetical protein
MLDSWIIKEILKREEERRREEKNDRLELPIMPYREDDRPSATPLPRDENRGVVTIDI